MEKKQQITPLQVTAAPRSVKWMRGTIAVCVILLMGSILLNFHYWSKGAEARIEIKQLKQQCDSLLQKVNALQPSPKQG